MNEVVKKSNEILLKRVAENLSKRNMEGFYASSKEEALGIVKKLLEGSKTVSHGGAESIKEIGLIEELNSGKYDYLNRSQCKDLEEARQLSIKALGADAFLGSVNAMTEDGILVNIDGNSNRVAAYAFGPKKLILVVGVNKITKDFDTALKRARNVAAPINCVRLNTNTPCAKLATCVDCLCEDTICCQFLITRYSRHKGRIKVVLVNDELGF